MCFLLRSFSGDFLLFCCLSSLFLVYYIFCDVIEVAVVPESLWLVLQEAQQKSTPSPCVFLLKKGPPTVGHPGAPLTHNHLDGGKSSIGRLFLDFF